MQTARSYLTKLGVSQFHIDNVYHLFSSPPPLPSIPKNRQPFLQHRIIGAVCRYFGYDVQEVLSTDRTHHLCECRHIIFHLLRVYGLGSLPTIGKLFNRDHTTVISGLKKADSLMFTDPDFRKNVRNLTVIVNEIIKD